MPKATIYIRTEDWQAWLGIADKPSFIHEAITGNKLNNEPVVEHTADWGA